MSDETKSIERKDAEKSIKLDEIDIASVSGRIETELKCCCEVKGKKFYCTRIRAERTSGIEDLIPVVIPQWLIGRQIMKMSLKGRWVEVEGQLRTRWALGEDNLKHLNLFLFATKITIYDEKDEPKYAVSINTIYLKGYICKQPKFRKTSSGRKIADLTIAVNTSNHKSYYISCIAWNKYARFADTLEVGEQVELYGRFQSRRYFKNTPNSKMRKCITTHEISAEKLQRVEI